MRLTLTRSGGILGSPLPPVIVETEALDEARRARLLNLVAASDFFRLPAALATTAQSGPDRFQYELEIQHGPGRTHSVKYGEETAPASLLELTQALRQANRG